MRNDTQLLAINAGSSSIKVAVFSGTDISGAVFQASIDGIGQDSSKLTLDTTKIPVSAPTHAAAASLLIEALVKEIPKSSIAAVGHRVVHGGSKYYQAQEITAHILNDLQTLVPFDPEHLPAQLLLIETFTQHFPQALQVACFDTAFHHDLPTSARLLPIPRKLATKGVRKYGFHGLSYEFIVTELRRVEGEMAVNGRVIIAHLGSGASLVGLRNGRPIDTTMGMTPASGIPMSTRSGDLDPGLALYLHQTEGYSLEKFNHMINFESGLLGVSETSADMKTLLGIEKQDKRAEEAVDMFCYQVRKSIGGLAASLGGLTTLVFTGGMGEQAPKIRARICDGLEFIGITLDQTENNRSARLISAHTSRVGVHVIHTNEAATIARHTSDIINSKQGGNR